MSVSKNKFKASAKTRQDKSAFVVTAEKAMRKAQKTAARENARFGLPLIVQVAH